MLPVAKSRRQVVLTRKAVPGSGTPPLGSRRDIREHLARFNTSGDGTEPKASRGTEVLYGPGMVIEIPLNMDSVAQAMVTMSDEDIAWPVLMRLCKELSWQMVDLESGRAFG